MYQALYRKWRPRTFDEVIGQQHITETLKNQVRNGRLSHAYLFIGTRGTGKTTCARILARAVNCEHPENGNPCGKCAACRGILEGSVMDVVELDAASNNGVDNVRALREEAVYSPSTVKKRVYIIDEVHMLSTQAFNALLKILEEPPEHLMFILATTELQKVPATILSRCQRHSFRRLGADLISEYLSEIARRENLSLKPEAADLIARLADGGVRDALSLLDQCSSQALIDSQAVYQAVGLAGNRRICELLNEILKHDSAKALQLFSGMWMDGKDPSSVLNEVSTLLRDILMLRVAPKAGLNLISGGFDERSLLFFAKRMTTEEILAAIETLQTTLAGLKDLSNPRTAAEICLVSLCCDSAGDSISSLRARISRLEDQMERGIASLSGAAVPIQPAPKEKPEKEAEDTDYSEEEAPEERLITSEEACPVDEREPEREPEGEAVPPPDPAQDLWPEIRSAAAQTLPPDCRFSLEDENRIRGRVEGNQIILEAQSGFLVARFQKQDVIQCLMEAGRRISGMEMRVQVRERAAEDRGQRSLEDLKQFKEVRFVQE